MTQAFIDFVASHRDADTAQLLLSADRYKGIDVEAAVRQIEGQRVAAAKWPLLLGCPLFEYPPRIGREQSSSQVAATYKSNLVSTLFAGRTDLHIADLTGGMGIDSIFFAKQSPTWHVDYIEQNQTLHTLMERNRQVLRLPNVACHCADSIAWLEQSRMHYDVIYIDPARRDGAGRKVVAFEQCVPDVLKHLQLLRAHSTCLIVKCSPMIDIDRAAAQLGCATQVHVVEVGGECKEVLFVCNGGAEMSIVAAVADAEGSASIAFTRVQDSACQPTFATQAARYIYEPCAALMKAAPYRLLCQWWGMPALDPNSHLYTAPCYRPVPLCNRVFEVLQPVALNRRAVQQALGGNRASVVCRNFPMAAQALQQRLGLAEGGDTIVLATTVARQPVGYLCRRLAPARQ